LLRRTSVWRYDEFRSIATIFITRRLLRRVLLSSDSANRPKIVLLIAIKDQARALHYLKAHPLVKSKLKSRPSVRRAPLLRRLFRLLQRHRFNCNNLLYLLTFEARDIIKRQRQSSQGRAANCNKGSSAGTALLEGPPTG